MAASAAAASVCSTPEAAQPPDAEMVQALQEQQLNMAAQHREQCAVAWNFCSNVVPNHPEVSISKAQVKHGLGGPKNACCPQNPAAASDMRQSIRIASARFGRQRTH